MTSPARIVVVSLVLSWSQPTNDAVASPSPNKILRTTDWANYNYGKHLRLHNGKDEFVRTIARHARAKHNGCRHTSRTARLRKVRYADVTGDGQEQAIVEIDTDANDCNGRHWKRREIIIFTERAGQPQQLGRFGPTHVRSVRLQARSILVDRLHNRGACIDDWRFDGKTFTLRSTRCHPAK